ncbi:alpha/beta fold hydrolase [Sphaerisporangium dianthi]|uniref:Alpha/beta fold hydrolase n=1 Tax=Sphaerisporangium dianthi TaxID=1436120 RepID=A0ABV9CCB5_9ACTN
MAYLEGGTMGMARNGDIELAYETFGATDGEPLLLISGTGVQMLIFPDDLCDALVDLGFTVARFDNRDTGLSTHLTGVPAPGWLKTMIRPSSAPYRLEDMAEDALAVLDALGWRSAHLVGTSLGGMIAQTLAIRHPARVRTLTSIMSTPGARIGTMPKIATLRAIMKLAHMPVTSPDQAAQEAVEMKKLIGSPRYPFDEKEAADIGRRSYERHPGSPDGDARQRAAVTASGDRRKALAALRVPTLVLHGEDDPVIRLKAGQATAAAIPGARLVTYPGMGHDLPRQLWPSMLGHIRALAMAHDADHVIDN